MKFNLNPERFGKKLPNNQRTTKFNNHISKKKTINLTLFFIFLP